jgi:hypothetical protein
LSPERIQRRVSLLRYLGLRSLTPPHTFIFVERWKWKEAEEEDQRTEEKGIQRKRYSEAKIVLHHKDGTKKGRPEEENFVKKQVYTGIQHAYPLSK